MYPEMNIIFVHALGIQVESPELGTGDMLMTISTNLLSVFYIYYVYIANIQPRHTIYLT
jgi:hypothetical protein